MVVPHPVLLGGYGSSIIGTINGSSAGGSQALVKKSDAGKSSKVDSMEFMYCIPDLEVFIDKTIKKCLLEYDLDANDTEAVLDDMEKAWPKSPTSAHVTQDPMSSGSSTDSDSAARRLQGSQESNSVLLVQTKGKVNESTKNNGYQIPSPPVTFKTEDRPESLANGKGDRQAILAESSRSDTSSPDTGNKATQIRKHPKLKTRLQERYFEGQESSQSVQNSPQSVQESAQSLQEQQKKEVAEKTLENWDASKATCNLDLLASAANIHTASARETGEHKLLAIRRLQEESEREFQENLRKRYQKGSLSEPGFGAMSKTVPTLTTFHDVQPRSSSFVGRGSPEVGHVLFSSTPVFENPSLVAVTRLPEVSSSSLISKERIQSLYEHYRNGYHAVIPPSSSSSESEQKLVRSLSSVPAPQSSQVWVSCADRPTLPYGHPSSSSRYPVHAQSTAQPQHTQSDTLVEQLQFRGSRIAHIIAEELQKDDGLDEPQRKTTLTSLERMSSDQNTKSSSIYEPRRAKSFSLPATHKRLVAGEAINGSLKNNHGGHASGGQTPVDILYQAASIDKINTHSKSVQKLLPAHLIMASSQLGPTVKPLYADGPISSLGKVDYPKHIPSGDDQPQDLSTKPKRSNQSSHQQEVHSTVNSNLASTLQKPETTRVSSTVTSSLSTVSIHLQESPNFHVSDLIVRSSQATNLGSNPFQVSQKHEGKDDSQNLKIFSVPITDQQIQFKKRLSAELSSGLSGSGDSEIMKRRKME